MYSMNEHTSNILDRLRSQLEEGFDATESTGRAMRESDILDRIRMELENDLAEMTVGGTAAGDEAMAGNSGAENPTDANDAFNMYLDSILDAILDSTDMSEEGAVNAIFDAAEMAAEEGDMPPMPEEDSSDDEISIWLGKAKTVGFARVVLDSVSMD